jgi:hypothetical protein
MRPYKYGPADKYGPFVALGMLLCCVAFYFLHGLNKIHGNFPVRQVLYSLPVAFFIWGLSALVDDPAPGHEKAWAENGQANYRTVSSFVTTMIFGSTVFTAAFIMFGVGK